MNAPFWVTALRLAAKNRRLTADCEDLLTALALARDDTDKARMDLHRVGHERDVALASGVELRCDVIALGRLNAILMQHAPSTIAELDCG